MGIIFFMIAALFLMAIARAMRGGRPRQPSRSDDTGSFSFDNHTAGAWPLTQDSSDPHPTHHHSNHHGNHATHHGSSHHDAGHHGAADNSFDSGSTFDSSSASDSSSAADSGGSGDSGGGGDGGGGGGE